jgi:hypothetical protein
MHEVQFRLSPAQVTHSSLHFWHLSSDRFLKNPAVVHAVQVESGSVKKKGTAH